MRLLLLLLAAVTSSSQAPSLHHDAFVMDGHIHVMTRQLLQGTDIGQRYQDGHVDLPRIRAGGLDAMFFSVYTPEAYYLGRHEVKNTFRVVELALDQIEKNKAVVDSHAQLRTSSASIARARWPPFSTSRAASISTEI